MSKIALITGITGQDGSYLAELLLSKGYSVHGIVRRSSTFGTERIDHLYKDESQDLSLHYGDITDGNALSKLMNTLRPDEVYNLAAQSHVKVSFDQPVYTGDATAIGTLKLLEAVRSTQENTGTPIRFYQASSSEMYGKIHESPQTENTAFYPRSPYGVAKLYSHWMTINYRESYGIHASCGILFNHESPRRGETFVTRKITRAVGRIMTGMQNELVLGNLDAERDWGFAGDYVEAMWKMLQQDTPGDYVVATGNKITVREFCKRAFDIYDLDYNDYVKIDPKYYRPTEVNELCGDASKANTMLEWKPTTSIDELIKMMVLSDYALATKEKVLADAGLSTNLYSL